MTKFTRGAWLAAAAVFALSGALALSGSTAHATDYTILGKKILVKGNLPSLKRIIVALAKEKPTDIGSSGQKGLDPADDPVTNGADLTITVNGNGGISSAQTFNVPAGAHGGPGTSGWKTLPVGFKYVNPAGPVKVLLLKRTPGDVVLLKAVIKGVDPSASPQDVTVEPPNGGTPDATMTLDILGGGNKYCTAWGGAAGGATKKNIEKVFLITNPTSEPPCPGPAPACGRLSFTTTTPGGPCGKVNDAVGGGGTDLTPYGSTSGPQLDCGGLYIGGGGSVQPPSPTPDGGQNIFKITDCTVATAYVLAATTSAETGSNRNCTSPNCLFGAPLPIPNPTVPAVSTCIINTIAAAPPAGGTLDATTGAATQSMPLNSTVYATGDLDGVPGPPIQPCPICGGLVPGQCDFGPNAGLPCIADSPGLGTSHDCPPPGSPLPTFGVDLSPLITGTNIASDPAGDFCSASSGQATNGCFGTGAGTCKYIQTNGSAPGSLLDNLPHNGVLASVFCIPPTGAPLIDAIADLPGPGAVTLIGDSQLIP